jgi:drug/metabolite transporter (DMT)-like permease
MPAESESRGEDIMTVQDLARPHRTAQGIVLILASVLTMAFADALVKLLSANLTLWQVFTARSLFAIAILVAIMLATRTRFRPRTPFWVCVRSLFLVLSWIFFYASLPVLSLSVAAVTVYTGPIMIALLSAALIGEPVTARQWGGILLGFLGVIVILRPGTDAFSWFTVLPLVAAVFYALSMVLTRSKLQAEAPLVLALGLHGAFLATGLIATAALALIGLGAGTKAAFPFLLGDEAAMGLREWATMALLGALSAAYFLGVARAYQIAAPTIIATFDYAYLVSAALWGFVFFAETPDLLTIGGMVLITAAGLLVAARPRPVAAAAAQ